MRFFHEDGELADLVRRYVLPDRRYRELGRGLLRRSESERAKVLRDLSAASRQITTRDLGVLLDGGWRERRTAAWMIAVAGRSETGFHTAGGLWDQWISEQPSNRKFVADDVRTLVDQLCAVVDAARRI